MTEQEKLAAGFTCSGCGCNKSIGAIRAAGGKSCCPERELVPPHVEDFGSYRWREFILICTCVVSPEQYEVYLKDSGFRIAYLRNRYGSYVACMPEAHTGIIASGADLPGDKPSTDLAPGDWVLRAMEQVRQSLIERKP